MKQLFGTDGIRGLAGEFPLDQNTVRMVGSSLARQLTAKLKRSPRFVTGRDTRESGTWIEEAFHQGAAAEGGITESAGVITTPGVAFLTREFDFDAGIVISASHNPFQDNGIKIFSPTGKKIDDAAERAIERDVLTGRDVAVVAQDVPTSRVAEFDRAYLRSLRENVNGFSAAGRKIVLDCANGAASSLGPDLFGDLGAEVIAINHQPNGRNINENSGSLHLGGLQAAVLEQRADIGIAFDGDADRALFVDENGRVVDGDATLWILTGYLKSHGKLANSTVVATVMSNIGLDFALKSLGVELIRTSVGDKYVLERLIDTGSELGGEQSGHIILPEISLVGDGMMTALLLLRAVSERAIPLSRAVEGFTPYPQILLNVRVREKQPFESVPAIANAAREIEQELHGEGRLLLRYSGTENLARVMIEGKSQTSIESQADRLAKIIEDTLG